MEFVSKGSLYSLLHSSEVISPSRKESIALDIAKGLAFLHMSKILHRDLKSLNVLIDEHYRAKLTDFGLSQVKVETSTLSSKAIISGTFAWMAPELFKRRAVSTEKSDVYSFGMVFWELLTRKVPFSDAKGNSELIAQWIREGEKEEIPEDTSPHIKSLILQCWDADPVKRPLASDIVVALQKEQVATSAFSATPTPVIIQKKGTCFKHYN
jgi:serine/threonine protein kinase